MAYTEVVEEKGKYRAVIEQDQDAQKPDWDSQTHILQVDSNSWGGLTISETMGDEDFAGEIWEAFNRFTDTYGRRELLPIFERYLRIFHGTTVFDTWNLGMSREYGYIAFDTAAWREKWGITEGHKDEDPLHDIRAWVEGDVWGIRLERKVGWTKTYEDADEDLDDEDGYDWVEVDDTACWGFYGQQYAEEEAKALMPKDCPRHGGPWGDDETCPDCTDEDGNPRV